MLNTERHRKILYDLIRDIYKSPAGAYLGFKGGTMLYFFHQLDRFSVDLDFDLLDESRKDEVYIEVRKILQRYGKIRDEADKNFTLFFVLSYGEGEHGVKVEISKRMEPRSVFETRNFYGVDVKIMKLEDSFANKLVAAVERKRVANRDFYDIYFLLQKNILFNAEIIRQRTGKSEHDFLIVLRKYIEKEQSQRGILEGLGELLDEKQKRWAKENLKKELLVSIDFLLDKKDVNSKTYKSI